MTRYRIDFLVDGELADTIGWYDDYSEADEEAKMLEGIGDGESFEDDDGVIYSVQIEECECEDDDDEFFGDPWRDAGMRQSDFI